jgi:acyl-CoA synthetase (AMP-forming)/AMP-acid ligase II
MTAPFGFEGGELRGQPGWTGRLRRHAHLRPERIALKCADSTRTYGELDKEVDDLTALFFEKGVREGDRVVVLMGNSIEMLSSLLAINRMGAIGVPVNFRLVAHEVVYLVRDCEASMIITDAERGTVAREVRAALDDPLSCLVRRSPQVAGYAADIAGPGASFLDNSLASCRSTAVEAVLTNDSPAFIMYTSGTTGRPKGAVLTHHNLFCQVFNYVVASEMCDEDAVSMCSVPMFHIAAIGTLMPVFSLGGTSIIMQSEAFDARRLVDTMERENVTDIFLVPTQWQAVCAVEGLERRDLHLRSIGWGASTTTKEILESMARYFPGARIVAYFGQTEMAPITCALRGEDSIRKLGSVGRPVATVDVRIVDDDMNDVNDGDVGEIVYRGPNLMLGYWKNPDANAEAFRGGWFHSGDLVRHDEEGFIFVVDRKKDVIVTGGENVYCAEVEATLVGHPKVLEVALIGVAHERWVETPVAYVVPAAHEHPPVLEELVHWGRAFLASFKLPTRLVIIDEMPRNASGKVLKTKLREHYQDMSPGVN